MCAKDQHDVCVCVCVCVCVRVCVLLCCGLFSPAPMDAPLIHRRRPTLQEMNLKWTRTRSAFAAQGHAPHILTFRGMKCVKYSTSERPDNINFPTLICCFHTCCHNRCRCCEFSSAAFVSGNTQGIRTSFCGRIQNLVRGPVPLGRGAWVLLSNNKKRLLLWGEHRGALGECGGGKAAHPF